MVSPRKGSILETVSTYLAAEQATFFTLLAGAPKLEVVMCRVGDAQRTYGCE